jgi:glycosyltransferase involved in cell wall biosynthesis
MELSLVFPAFNEAANIREAVGSALAYLARRTGEVVVVNDGSGDETGALLDGLTRQHPDRVRAIHHPKNLGYAAALRDGFLAARGDWVFYTDADNQFDLAEIDRLWALREGMDLVVGYRLDRKDPPFRLFTARVWNLMIRALFGLRGVRDVDCAFKLFRRGFFDIVAIRSSGFLVDAELLVKAQRAGLKITETGVHHRPRVHGRSTVRVRHVLQALAGLGKLWWEIH